MTTATRTTEHDAAPRSQSLSEKFLLLVKALPIGA